MTDTIVELDGLSKRYGGRLAVDDVSLQLERGEVFGLLGPNGSGKTTTILMLLGLTDPDDGKVRVMGMDPARAPLSVKRHVGYLPENVGFYEDLTGLENLSYIGRLNGMSRAAANRRAAELLGRIGLGGAAGRRVGGYSRGMRQRLGIATVLLKDPILVILDEPTLGLDPEAAEDFLAMVRRLKDDGITVLLSSHILPQVQAVCDRVGLFHDGRLALCGSVPDIARQVLGASVRITLQTRGQQDESGLRERLAAIEGVRDVRHLGDGRWRIDADGDLRGTLNRSAVTAGIEVIGLAQEMPSLDEVYRRYFEERSHGPA